MMPSRAVGKVRQITEQPATKQSTAEDDDTFSIYCCDATEETKRRMIINGQDVTGIIDTGADVSILPSLFDVPVDLRPSLLAFRLGADLTYPCWERRCATSNTDGYRPVLD